MTSQLEQSATFNEIYTYICASSVIKLMTLGTIYDIHNTLDNMVFMQKMHTWY